MQSKFLNNKFDKVAAAAKDAVAWLESVDDETVQKAAPALCVRLCRLAKKASSASEVLPVNTAVGVFGPSQAGKSYLVSTLASTGGGDGLVASWDGHEISFISHLNPQGGDREATGLVTRFTHKKTPSVPGYPVLVKVFNEADLVRVLINSYFADLALTSDYLDDHGQFFKSDAQIDALFAKLNTAEYQLKDGETAYHSQADLVSIADYCKEHSKGSVLATSELDINCRFWQEARKIYQKLNLKGRKAIYEKLWHEMPVFNNLFDKIAPGIVSLEGMSSVYVPLSCFVNSVDGRLMQRSGGTLNDIAALKSLLSEEGQSVKVSLDDKGQKIVDINFNVLAFATAEITFPLPEKSAAGNFDVLDFPGARSRNRGDLNIWKQASGAGTSSDNDGSEFARRGKVGYLIERYCERREVDVLLCCIGADKQQEVRDLEAYFTSWIDQNVGDTPQKRAKSQKIPLVGAFTRFDGCVTRTFKNLGSSESDVGKTITTALEKFNVKWMQEWTENNPFDQFFFVRKPNIPDSETLYRLENGKEVALKDDDEKVKTVLDTYRKEIVKDPFMKHVYGFRHGNCQTIEEVLKPNDGGVSFLADFLKSNFDGYEDGKSRSYDELVSLSQGLRKDLSMFAQEEGQKAQDEARQKATDCALKLMQCDRLAGTVASLRAFIEIDENLAFKNYMENLTDGISNNAYRFAKALTSMHEDNLKSIREGDAFKEMWANIEYCWSENKQNEVEDFPDSKKLSEYSFFIDDELHVIRDMAVLKQNFSQLLNYYTIELLKSYKSLNVEGAVVEKISEYEKQVSTKEELALGQTFRALQVISDFNTYLDFFTEDKCPSVRRILNQNSDREFFTEKFEVTANMNLPKITASIIDKSADNYYDDYFSRMVELVSFKNITAGSQFNINPDQNRALCEILASIDDGISE